MGKITLAPSRAPVDHMYFLPIYHTKLVSLIGPMFLLIKEAEK